MTRQAARQFGDTATGVARPSAAEDPAGREAPASGPLDPLIAALARALDRLEGTAR